MPINTFYRILMAFITSFLIQYFVISRFQNKPFCVDCGEADKPQRFHNVPTPRAGGLGIFVAVASALPYAGMTGHVELFLLLSSIPAFFAGFYEDLKKNISPRTRLTMQSAGAVVAIILLNTIIYDTGIFHLPLWIAIPFTVFAVVGVANSINIIDGFNGLASGVAVIAFASYSVAAFLCNDYLIFNICLIIIASIIGFFVWNYPTGKIFLGDGGAYLIGFLLAVISISLFNRHSEISPLYTVVILIYPIFEVLFSIYRRIVRQGVSALLADRAHLHSLLYRRIIRNNPRTSFYMWIPVALFNIAAFPFRGNNAGLIIMLFVFAAAYIYTYKMIVRFNIVRFNNEMRRRQVMHFVKVAIFLVITVVAMSTVYDEAKHPKSHAHAGVRKETMSFYEEVMR